MPELVQTRDAAVLLLRRMLPDVRVAAFCGDAELGALAKRGVHPGGNIFVAAMSAVNTGAGLELDMRATLGAFCISRRAAQGEREMDALALAEAVALHLHGDDLGLSFVSPARITAVNPLPDTEMEQSGVTVWAVLWEQHIVFALRERGGEEYA